MINIMPSLSYAFLMNLAYQIVGIVQLIGLFTPLWGVVVIIALANSLSGRNRWLVLFLAPLVTVVISFLFLKYGNYELAGLIGGILLFFFIIGLLIYYPILIIRAIRAWTKPKENGQIAI